MTAPVIMVDELRRWPHATGIFRAGSAHLTVDGATAEHIEALHTFAKRIGLKREWFQDHRLAPHYDLVQSRRDAALVAGAVFVDSRTQAERRIAARAGESIVASVSTPTTPSVQRMKILSVWGPWAQLLVLGIKDVENRGWTTTYRGPVAIHASKGGHSRGEVLLIVDRLRRDGLITHAQSNEIEDRAELDRGHVIGVVQLVGAKRTSKSPWWVKGEVALEVAGARLVDRIPVVGKQGLRDFVLPRVVGSN